MHLSIFFWTIGILLCIGAGIIFAIFAWRRTSTPPEDPYRARTPQASALAAYYSRGHDLITPGSGTSDGLRYGIYITSPLRAGNIEAYVEQSSVLYVLDLPFNTGVHLLGVNRTYPLNRLHLDTFLQTIGMAKVQLDPTMAEDCDIYTGREHAFQVQSALDPDALSFVRHYWRTHVWELHDSELYVVVPEHAIGDSSFVIESHSFVEAIRPVLPAASANAPIVHREIPFDIYDGPAMRCPICQKHMVLQDSAWFRCKHGHGLLVTDREIERLIANKFPRRIDVNAIMHHGPLTCPSCHYPMEITRYNSSALEINKCINCRFSWVDTDDHSGLSSLSIGSKTSASA